LIESGNRLRGDQSLALGMKKPTGMDIMTVMVVTG
jgi:hypothetical protein